MCRKIWASLWLSGKEFAYSAGDSGSVPGLGRSRGRGNGNLLQCSCLKIPMDRGAWRATVQRVTGVRHDLPTEHAHV